MECAVNQPGVAHPVSGSAYLVKMDPQGKIKFDMTHKRRFSTFLSVEQTRTIHKTTHYTTTKTSGLSHNHIWLC